MIILYEGTHATYEEVNGNGVPPSKRSKYSDNASGMNASERYSWTPNNRITQYRQLPGSVLHNGASSLPFSNQIALSRESLNATNLGAFQNSSPTQIDSLTTMPVMPHTIRKVKLLVKPQKKPPNGSE